MLPKYVHLFYVEDHWQVQSNGAVIHESIFSYQLAEWAQRNGYEHIVYNRLEDKYLLERNTNHA